MNHSGTGRDSGSTADDAYGIRHYAANGGEPMTDCPQCRVFQSKNSLLRHNLTEQIRLLDYQQHQLEAANNTKGDAVVLARMNGQRSAFVFVKHKMRGM